MVRGDAKPILENIEVEVDRIRELNRNAFTNILLMQKHDKHIHLRSSLSCLTLLSVLVGRYLRRGGDNTNRDWLVLSKGHAAPALYAILAEMGSIPRAELSKINGIDSMLQNHTELSVPGVDFASGSLAQGISFAIGIAAWIKRVGGSGRVFVVLGDGEQDEGQVWEAITHAVALNLDNLIVLVDMNGRQLDGKTDEVKPKHYIPFVWKAVGWRVLWADGGDVVSLIMALEEALESDKPVVIFAQTHHIDVAFGVEHVGNAH